MPAWPTAILLVAPPAIDFSICASFWERSFSEYVLRAVFAAAGASAAGGVGFAPFLRTGFTSSAFAFLCCRNSLLGFRHFHFGWSYCRLNSLSVLKIGHDILRLWFIRSFSINGSYTEVNNL